MDYRKLPVTWLRTFEVAARHLSLSSAATELNVTPAAVSQQVRLLEHRLGEQLFLRHSRGLRLTPAGEALAPSCRESFERLNTALTELFGDRKRPKLVIRVALGFARKWLLDKLACFSRSHPEISIRLIASVWDGNTPEGSVDLDLRLASGPIAGLESYQLTRDRIFPVCSPKLVSGPSPIRRMADLRSHILLTTVGFNEGWRHWYAAAGIDDSVPSSMLEFDSMRLALEMAALGCGVCLARSSYADEMLRAGQLKSLFDISLKASDNIFLTHGRRLDAGAPAILFRDWILAQPAQRRRR